MLPLKVAVLWHFHQPYYKKEGEFILPWVRLHGVKDYFDLPELFHEYPNMKQTINIVPSLQLQLEEYVARDTSDKVQRLTLKKAGLLTEEDKKEILRLFFLCNIDNMVKPYPRYRELLDKAGKEHDLTSNYSNQDWLDLQVWYNLTWIGQISSQRPAVKRLFKKGTNFTEEEKIMLMDIHLDILNQIKPMLKSLESLGQIELSCSPMYHPILPLLCNSKSALEAMPNAMMPNPIYKYPDDAKSQIDNALNYIENIIGKKPVGMWPSEGSLSDEVLELLAKSNVKWVASDEEMLAATQMNKYSPLEKFFPRKFKTNSGNIAILFRDHHLSDALGFVYSRWNPFDAVNNFCHRLREIKNGLVSTFGEDCLKHAVVPVILDGENCWEYYNENGINFRREFSRQLSESDEFITVTCEEATAMEHCSFMPALNHVRAGSWINSDFKIWIGHEEDRTAWNMLGNARKAFEEHKEKLTLEALQTALNEIAIAEGSDWFWWYGDEHISDTKGDFDDLFRWHIGEIYKAIGLEIPEDVFKPIADQKQKCTVMEPIGSISPDVDGKLKNDQEWQDAGFYDAVGSMSAMHQIGELLVRLWYGSDDNKLYFRCDCTRKFFHDEYMELQFILPKAFTLVMKRNIVNIKSESGICLDGFEFADDDLIEIAFDKKTFFGDNKEERKTLQLVIRTKSREGELFYPRQGVLELVV